MPEHLDEPRAGHHCYRYCRHWQQPVGAEGTAAGLPHPLLRCPCEQEVQQQASTHRARPFGHHG